MAFVPWFAGGAGNRIGSSDTPLMEFYRMIHGFAPSGKNIPEVANSLANTVS
jgi:hypothetical protein